MPDLEVGGNRSTLTSGAATFRGRAGADPVDDRQDKVVTGALSQNGDGTKTVFNIPHGLGKIPTYYDVQPSNNVTNATRLVTADATNIIVTYGAAPVSGTANVLGRWIAVV